MYQPHDLYTYVQQLYHYMQSQEERITQLEARVAQLSQDLLQLKSEKQINIEKIEYHFDQLKVETLEGTLNIGFTPSGIADQVDEFSVNGKDITGSLSEGSPEHPSKAEPIHRMMSRVEEYLNREFANDIRNFSERYQVPIDTDFYPMILDEIKKQIEPRIRHYLTQAKPLAGMESANLTEERIFAQTKQDIRLAIENFIRGIPNK